MPKIVLPLLLLGLLAGCAPPRGVPADGYRGAWPPLGPLFRQREIANHPGN
ncbi:hypothetical protein [Sediminicoccus rosea]|uniref:Uncharacterized protein n=1 Tax=Sediminicoccus rosea TaxID=1225128 RepID=A0ABZ0PJU0_9PROT|nr:hypothetical protein [Sediminicoccus rosea]WPB85536.1 hypothetical protein R9Z33_01370 [Sediminicoccus rosea]